MKIVNYPHPTLRHVSKPLRRVDAELKTIVREMFGMMYEHNGVGLAANQVDLPYRLFLVNTEGDPSKGEEMVFINPVLSSPKGSVEGEEGCLSIPETYADVRRAERITVEAYMLSGQEFRGEVDGLLARVIQHETDHLDGKLFIDRIAPTAQADIREKLDELEIEFEQKRGGGEIPDDETIAARLAELEKLRCV